MKPNGYICGECEHWDDVNGCWLNAKSFAGKNCDPPEEDEFDEEEKTS